MNRLLKLVAICFLETILIHVSRQTSYSCSSNASCGCSAQSAILTKIVGGEAAASQTWGWSVSLRYTSTNSHFCGGSLISNSHILTAAHCTIQLSSASSVRVYVGSIYLSLMVQAPAVFYIHTHPNYSSTTYVNDIAILKLSSPLNLDQTGVDLVCLPNVSSTILAKGEYPAANISLVAIGWGVESEDSETVSSTLEQVTIQSVAANSTYCRNVYIADASKQLCAGVMPAGGKDTCQGDSGSPLLMFTSQNVWEQVGITSNGEGCARAGLPGIYTRVAAYQSWINDTMNSANPVFIHSYLILIPLVLLILL